MAELARYSEPGAEPPANVVKYSSWSTPMAQTPCSAAALTPPEPVCPPAPQMTSAARSYWFHAGAHDDLTAYGDELQRRYSVFPPLEGAHMHCAFGHLDGYSSGYYTYMWSLVIAKDLFSAFDPDDLFAADVALAYRDKVLAMGGRKDAADLVADFLGRPYSFDSWAAWLAE